MNILFNIPPIEKKEPVSLFPDKKCRQCKNLIRPNPYSEKYTYCQIKKCKRTPYGVKRIKPMDKACNQFENK